MTIDSIQADENQIERNFNAATYFIDRHLDKGRSDKIAFIDAKGEYSYCDLARRVNQIGNALKNAGVRQESRVAMIVQDTIDFPAIFWGAIKAGVVPVSINTLLTTEHYRYILNDCRAQILFVSQPVYATVEPLLKKIGNLEQVVILGKHNDSGLQAFLGDALTTLTATQTTRDDACFWLYSSGSTGNPKGVIHRHANLYWTARLYGHEVLGIHESDVVYSAAKLFFAYGLGNGMSFPLDVGATAVLLADRPTPGAVMKILRQYQPTIFCGVPTLYAAILANPENNRETGSRRLRRCVSAGEALPEEIGREFETRFGAEILDGVGSTEMLQTYLSNRSGDNQYGCSGVAVPGYDLRLVDENGNQVAYGEIGELMVKAPSACDGYHNQREKNHNTFIGPWAYSGDKYFQNGRGYYVYCGRADDMFKSGGNWVSPFEVESTLIAHAKVLEAAVVPHKDDHGNVKPKAFVVLQDGVEQTDSLVEDLKNHAKETIEVWKYPRWIEFCNELPRTATGKMQRYKLREKCAPFN
jgi:4-hydroxybenzoate-CoA ligase